jgi:hypothetical protein
VVTSLKERLKAMNGMEAMAEAERLLAIALRAEEAGKTTTMVNMSLQLATRAEDMAVLIRNREVA